MTRLPMWIVGLTLVAVAPATLAARAETYEQAINRADSRAPFYESPAKELRYRVGFQYADRARREPETTWKVRGPDAAPLARYDGIDLAIAASNFGTGQGASGALDLVNWLNAGLSKESHYAYYVSDTTPLVSLPNTHFYRFDEREGTATAEDVYLAWDRAYALMARLYRAEDCHVFGWTPELQYARTYMKDRPGSHRQILYLCDHPFVAGEKIRVEVAAYANPAPGLRTVSFVQQQCWLARKPKEWWDQRPCGVELANRQRPSLPSEPDARWMQIFTTATADDPAKMITIARYADRELSLEPPPLSDAYIKFLRSKSPADARAPEGARVVQ